MITGRPVDKGWLPGDKSIRHESDKRVLSAKVIGLISEDEMYSLPFRKILGKAERMTDKERFIIKVCIKNLPIDKIAQAVVPFKQNMISLFFPIRSWKRKINLSHCMDCVSILEMFGSVSIFSLTREDYHLRTSQKRLMVKLLESFPVFEFTENLILFGGRDFKFSYCQIACHLRFTAPLWKQFSAGSPRPGM